MARGLIGKGTLLYYADTLAALAGGGGTLIGGVGDMGGSESTVVRSAFAYMDMPTIDKSAVFGTADRSDLTFNIIYEQGGQQQSDLEALRGLPKFFKRVKTDGSRATWAGAITKVGDEVPIDKEITLPVSIGFDGGITVTPASGTQVSTFYTVTIGGGGTSTIDLTACGPTASIDLTALGVTKLDMLVPAANTAAVVVTTAVSTGYSVGGEAVAATIKKGNETLLTSTVANAGAVGSGAKDLTVTGTAGDKLIVNIVAE
jgi:hypothetical protein